MDVRVLAATNQDLEDSIEHLQRELQERQHRVSQLEDLLQKETEALKRLVFDVNTMDITRNVNTLIPAGQNKNMKRKVIGLMTYRDALGN